MDGLPITEGPLALFGRIELTPPGRVDHAEDWLSPFHEGDTDAAVLVSAGIVGRPVDRADDPDGLVPGDLIEILLLTEETHLGEAHAKLLREEMLDGEIGRGDDILADALVMDLEPAGAVHVGGCGPDNVRDQLYVDICHSCCTDSFCLRIASR